MMRVKRDRAGGMRARRNFTTVEMLVVAATLCVMAAISLPALQKVRDAALHVTCMAQMRQIGVAFSLYSNDFQGYIPPINTWNAGNWRSDGLANQDKSLYNVAFGWAENLSGNYMKSPGRHDMGVFQCPFDEEKRAYHSSSLRSGFRTVERLSYARLLAVGISMTPSYRVDAGLEGYAGENRLAAYFWPHRPDDAVCEQAEADDGPCRSNCPPGERLRNSAGIVLLAESHDNPGQTQSGWNAQISAGQWWSYVRGGLSSGERMHPHWSYHRGGPTVFSSNALAVDGHVFNISPDVRPHARWRLTRRPRGFPPIDTVGSAYRYGYLPPY